MNRGREDANINQVHAVVVSGSYPGGGGRRHQRGIKEGGKLTQCQINITKQNKNILSLRIETIKKEQNLRGTDT